MNLNIFKKIFAWITGNKEAVADNLIAEFNSMKEKAEKALSNYLDADTELKEEILKLRDNREVLAGKIEVATQMKEFFKNM